MMLRKHSKEVNNKNVLADLLRRASLFLLLQSTFNLIKVNKEKKSVNDALTGIPHPWIRRRNVIH